MSAGAVTPLFKLLSSSHISHQTGPLLGSRQGPSLATETTKQNINSALDIYCQLVGRKNRGVCPCAGGTVWRFWKVPEGSKVTLWPSSSSPVNTHIDAHRAKLKTAHVLEEGKGLKVVSPDSGRQQSAGMNWVSVCGQVHPISGPEFPISYKRKN